MSQCCQTWVPFRPRRAIDLGYCKNLASRVDLAAGGMGPMSDNTATLSPLWPGVPLALASAALFGASAPFAKLLLGSTDPQLLAGLLYLGAGIGLAIGQAGRSALGVGTSEAPLRRADMPWLIAIIAFGGVAGPLLLMLGLARTSAASGSLLMNLEGLATMALAWVVFRENVDRRLLLGAASILAGAFVLSWQGQGLRIDGGGVLGAASSRQRPDGGLFLARAVHRRGHCDRALKRAGHRSADPRRGAYGVRPLAASDRTPRA